MVSTKFTYFLKNVTNLVFYRMSEQNRHTGKQSKQATINIFKNFDFKLTKTQ